jgi:hypothetical protein
LAEVVDTVAAVLEVLAAVVVAVDSVVLGVAVQVAAGREVVGSLK